MATLESPPGLKLPAPVSVALYLTQGDRVLSHLRRRHGDVFSLTVPVFGRAVVVARPDLVREIFTAPTDVLSFGEVSPLGDVLGPGSLFSMDGERHISERRLILPAFHGERMKAYELIVEEEARREMEGWPLDQEFPTMPGFMRITLNAILKTVFGAEGGDVQELAAVLPPFVTIASRLTLLPWLQRDLGPRSPGGRFHRLRARYDAIIERMIDQNLADPNLDQRDDVMSMLLRAHYEDGSSMSRKAIADELLTLLAAGHETTATSLAWAVERLRRHPWITQRLAAEARAGDQKTLRTATIYEVQRTRPVITATGRHVMKDFQLGEWLIPKGHHLVVSASMIHSDERFFERAAEFQPDRWIERSGDPPRESLVKPGTYTWVPFGGGTRRCIGAAFAHMEMDIVLRTLLRRFDLVGSTDPDEEWSNRGVAYAPSRGGRAVVTRRTV